MFKVSYFSTVWESIFIHFKHTVLQSNSGVAQNLVYWKYEEQGNLWEPRNHIPLDKWQPYQNMRKWETQYQCCPRCISIAHWTESGISDFTNLFTHQSPVQHHEISRLHILWSFVVVYNEEGDGVHACHLLPGLGLHTLCYLWHMVLRRNKAADIPNAWVGDMSYCWGCCCRCRWCCSFALCSHTTAGTVVSPPEQSTFAGGSGWWFWCWEVSVVDDVVMMLDCNGGGGDGGGADAAVGSAEKMPSHAC